VERIWIGLAGLAGFAAVATAALAAHVWPAQLDPAALQMARNALRVHGWHALALLACGLWVQRGGRLVDLAGFAFVLGLILFCGAVYARALGGLRTGAMAPVGGISLMLGWVLLGLSAFRRRPARSVGG
jgi:uncharacterized membrane protein YgdD (TMEM256/DUF423 family)